MTRRPAGSLYRRVAGFAVVPAFSVLSPLLLLPLISARFGSDGWSAVAIGQSIGGAASIIVGLSWPTVGAHLVASARDDGDRRALYAESLVSRLSALVVLAPIGMLAAAFLAPGHGGVAAACALGVTLNGLTSFWWFVGVGTPGALMRNEALPRLVVSLVSALLLAAGSGLASYGLALVVGGAASALLNHATIVGRRPVVRRPLRQVLRGLPAQHGIGTASRVAYGVYSTASVGIVALTAPLVVANYAAIDRLWRTAFNGLNSVPQGFAGWVSGLPARRSGLAAGAMTGLAVAAFAGLWLVFPLGMDVLYSGKASWSGADRVLAAAVLALSFLGQALALVAIVPLGGERAVYLGNAVAAALGLVLLPVLARSHGVSGALVAVVIAEASVSVVLLTQWTRLRRRSRALPPPLSALLPATAGGSSTGSETQWA